MRAFYLLLGEFWFRQRLEDARFYKLISVWCKDPPEPGEVFPSLRVDGAASEADDLEDDELIFQRVAGSLMPYAE